MPRLINRRHEWFAHHRARGLRLEEAYERAGYAPDRSHACRLASRPEVAERITELRGDFTDVVNAERSRVIEALMAIAEASRALGTPEGLKEARFAFVEAAALQQRIADDLAKDRDIIEREMSLFFPQERRAGALDEADARAERAA
jgi:phage terminase small subunit